MTSHHKWFFLLVELTWKALIVLTLHLTHAPAEATGIVITIVVVCGALEVLFLGGTAALESYAKVAFALRGTGNETSIMTQPSSATTLLHPATSTTPADVPSVSASGRIDDE